MENKEYWGNDIPMIPVTLFVFLFELTDLLIQLLIIFVFNVNERCKYSDAKSQSDQPATRSRSVFLPPWMFINDKGCGVDEYYEAEYPHVEAAQI